MPSKTSTLHMIGNAHIDPVWLWRFQDGLSEIKATFRSALDRIKEFDEFVFTCGCAMYYEWVEKNCLPLFEEIQQAVKDGKWIIVGGMWIQPDCNMPSSESFSRQMLYSQNYFMEKFGVRAETGYNVDSFGHSSGLPRLLREGGMKNYTYMRPSRGPEMQYPFLDRTYRWQCGDSELLTFRIPSKYNHIINEQSELLKMDRKAEEYPYPLMFFYGVGNHGGGPTIANIQHILHYRETAERPILFSHPDQYFQEIREKHFNKLPVYVGELQNHASGCYSANSKIKMLNRAAEGRLTEAERMEVLSATCAGHDVHTADHTQAWKKVLFNQFHDIMCGCVTKAATEDAYTFEHAAIAHGLEMTNAAVQRISWAIDTHREGAIRSKDLKGAMWESNNLGTPVVVFNPLSYPARIPVMVHLHTCTAVTDENCNPVPFQMVRNDYTNRALDTRLVSFIAEVPAYGWRTYWVYRERTFPEAHLPASNMQVGPYHLSNGKTTVRFNPATGEVASMVTADGEQLGAFGCRALVIDDSPNDTWAHARFVFEEEKGCFGNPFFKVIDEGDCQVSLRVTQTYRTNTLERTYTLYRDDETLYVSTRLVMNEAPLMVKFAFDAGLPNGAFIREVPGDILATHPAALKRDEAGRELPMLRYMAIHDETQKKGLAVVNNGKYSASSRNGELRMVAARTCYYGDHFGQRDGTEHPQDIGEQEFRYAIRPFSGNTADICHTADALNTEFPVITETYHKGTLPQTASYAAVDAHNVSITCIKAAEDSSGIIIRLTESAGKETACNVQLLGTAFIARLKPLEIRTFRLTDGTAMPCNFLEEEI